MRKTTSASQLMAWQGKLLFLLLVYYCFFSDLPLHAMCPFSHATTARQSSYCCVPSQQKCSKKQRFEKEKKRISLLSAIIFICIAPKRRTKILSKIRLFRTIFLCGLSIYALASVSLCVYVCIYLQAVKY